MVIDFSGHVFAAPFIPAIAVDFAQEVRAVFTDQESVITEQSSGNTDSVTDVVIGSYDEETASAKGLNKAGGGRIDDNAFDFPISRQAEQIVGIFLIGFLASGLFGIVVEFSGPDPSLSEFTPESEGSGVHGTVIHRDSPSGELVFRRRVNGTGSGVKEIVNEALGGAPLTEDEAAVKGTGIRAFIAFSDLWGQGRVIFHREMEMQCAAFSGLEDPLLIEPMLLIFRITVKPKAASLDAAPCNGLFDEGARHQSGLIQQDAREGTALNKRRAGLISAAEEEE